ncbi:MAG: GNAT family N-acetyltransferase [Phycisphaeraceae bacterium]|nr:GNAT family N-acetyltransferase [Phycisphaeraceae bacterium]
MGALAETLCPLRPTGRCVVRSAAVADAPLVLDCAREVFQTSQYTLTCADEFTMTLDEEAAFIASLESHPRQIMLVAYDEPAAGEPPAQFTGILVLKQNTSRRKLRHSVDLGMSVRSTHRGRAVGSALLGRAVEWARAHPDLRQITLAVYAANAPGLALYRRLGFVEHGRLPDGLIHDDGRCWEQVLMHLMVEPLTRPASR